MLNARVDQLLDKIRTEMVTYGRDAYSRRLGGSLPRMSFICRSSDSILFLRPLTNAPPSESARDSGRAVVANPLGTPVAPDGDDVAF